MTQKFNILILTILSLLIYSCNNDDTVYVDSKNLDIKFIPISPYGTFAPTPNKDLITYTCVNIDNITQNYLIKIDKNGNLDSVAYTIPSDDRGYSTGTIETNNNNDIYIYNNDIIAQKIVILKYINGDLLNQQTLYCPEIDGYAPTSGTPLNDGGFLAIGNKREEYSFLNEWAILRIDKDGNQFPAIPIELSDAYNVYYTCTIEDNIILQYSDTSGDTKFAFLTLDGKILNTIVIKGFSMTVLKRYGNSLYCIINTYDNTVSNFVIQKLDSEGHTITETIPLHLNTIKSITEVDNKVIISTYDYVRNEKKTLYDQNIGKIYLLNKDNFSEIDSIIMNYNVIPHAVFSDEKDGYNVFLSRKFNYSLEESLNSSYDNVYIYHTDNLKNLEIDPEL